jgi:hypothetical protein
MGSSRQILVECSEDMSRAREDEDGHLCKTT